jgi:hypothetical protein
MQATLAATHASLRSLQRRLSTTVSGSIPAALFQVAVELSVPSVGLNPSPATIQATIDTTAQKASSCMEIWLLPSVQLFDIHHVWI